MPAEERQRRRAAGAAPRVVEETRDDPDERRASRRARRQAASATAVPVVVRDDDVGLPQLGEQRARAGEDGGGRVRREPAEPRLAVDQPARDRPAGASGSTSWWRDLVPLRARARRRRRGTRSAPAPTARPRGARSGRGSGRRRSAPRGGTRNLRGRCIANRRSSSKRVNRVASAVERRGIVATYQLHDRLLGNRSARQPVRSAGARARRDAAQDRRRARPRGVRDAAVHPTCSTRRQWKAIEAQGDAFVAETERTIAEGGSGKVRAGKEFVVARIQLRGRRRSQPTTRGSRSCASRRMLDVANAYLRLWAKLSYVDLWYTAQQPATDERVASQNWHVDFDDKHLLKAFVYLSDVGADHGPFEYVPGSQPGGRHHDVRPWVPMGYGRVADEDVARSVPPRRSRRSPARRARSSSATRAACIAAASRPRGRACSRPRPTARPPRSSRSRTATTRRRSRARRPTRSSATPSRRRASLDALGRPLEQRPHAAAAADR